MQKLGRKIWSNVRDDTSWIVQHRFSTAVVGDVLASRIQTRRLVDKSLNLFIERALRDRCTGRI